MQASRAHGSELREPDAGERTNSDALPRIGVLVGGASASRALSLRAADPLLKALRARGHQAAALVVDRDIDPLLRQHRIGTAVLALQAPYGDDGCLQGLLEVLGIPYTGSGVLASALAANRAKTKELLRLHNLPTAPAYVFDAEVSDSPVEVRDARRGFGGAVLVRPVCARAGLGSSVARDELELESALEDALRFGEQVLVERHFEGREMGVALLDGEPLGALELPRNPHAALWAAGSCPPVFPARLSTERYRALLRLGALAYDALGCEGAACVHLLVSDKENEVVLEVDALPALTPTGIVGRVARAAGIDFPELVNRVLQGARLHTHGRRRNRRLVQGSFEGPEKRSGYAPAAH